MASDWPQPSSGVIEFVSLRDLDLVHGELDTSHQHEPNRLQSLYPPTIEFNNADGQQIHPNAVHNATLANLQPHFRPNANTSAVLNASRQSSLDPTAQEFFPTRSLQPQSHPQLTLMTGFEDPVVPQEHAATPTTPSITIQTVPDAIQSTNVRTRRISQSRGRGRRRSSPARRATQSLNQATGSEISDWPPVHSSGQRHLSPAAAVEGIQHWIGDPEGPINLVRCSHAAAMLATPPTQRTRLPSPAASTRSQGQGQGPWYCSVPGCKKRDKPWNIQSALKKHERTHLPVEERLHSCPVCSKRFWYPKDVARHCKSEHEGGTQSFCQICAQVFSRADNLTRHCEMVHGISPASLSVAGSSAASPASTVSSISEMMYSGPPTPMTSRLSQKDSPIFSRQRPLLPAGRGRSFIDEAYTTPSSVPMSRNRTN